MAPKKLIKPGRVVVLLNGRYAGRKAVVVQTFDDGTSDRQFGHCLVAGLANGPKRVTKSMSLKKIRSRSNITPFVRFINYNHMLPTRYTVEWDMKTLPVSAQKNAESVTVDEVAMKDGGMRPKVKQAVKVLLQRNYDGFDQIKDGKSKVGAQYLYEKLHF